MSIFRIASGVLIQNKPRIRRTASHCIYIFISKCGGTVFFIRISPRTKLRYEKHFHIEALFALTFDQKTRLIKLTELICLHVFIKILPPRLRGRFNTLRLLGLLFSLQFVD